MKNGFTLLEVIVAVSIMTTAVIGLSALLQQTMVSTGLSSSRLTASYLAQEGMEIVRNTRDSNWLEQRTNPAVLWDEGIVSSDWQQVIFIDGTQSNFQRRIIITHDGINILKVSVEVSWSERGRSHQVVVRGNLYNWR